MASAPRFSFRALAALTFICHLAACGNAYESLQIGEWEPAGEITIPAEPQVRPAPGIFRVTTLDPGEGRGIKAGSLVEIRLAAKSGLLKDAATLKPLQNATAWLWVGNALPGHRRIDFGFAPLRASLVGLRQGARVSVFADPKKIGFVLLLPTRAFLQPFSYKPTWKQSGPGGDAATSLDREYTELASEGNYEVEILRVCDGRLFRLQALLKQWGFVFNWGDMDYEFSRQGVLEWLAIEADCESPNEKIRFEKGPAYGIGSPGYPERRLLWWQASYEEAVRKSPVLRPRR